MKKTKQSLVLQHLLAKKTITSLEAIKLFSATRLSAIIFQLKKKGYEFTTKPHTIKDRYGNTCNYVQYILTKSMKVKQSVGSK